MLDASKRILELYEDNESQIFIIEGWNGYGKTSYANHILSEVYSKDGKTPNWDIPLFKEHLGFHPMHVLKKWRTKHKIAKTFQLHPNDYVYHWDDAGAFLHSLDYNNPYVKQVGKYLQVFRSDWSCIIFSCIDAEDLTKKIRGLSSAITIKITKRSDTSFNSQRFRRIATAKHVEKDWYNNVYWKDDWTEEFNCKMPDAFFSWYDPLRRQYSQILKKMMSKTIKEEQDIVKTYKDIDF